ncbi:hypothetical protein [Kozakia baliensis]|uniref:hypothetical protein n=1 Tax=Kozakia baliensis TaxID=153496 RepID=UPI000497A601|nr:hypothetical protein [Kozakia baliensis]
MTRHRFLVATDLVMSVICKRATASLKTAPWQPNASASGEIIPGKGGARSLTLSSNQNIHTRPATPDAQSTCPDDLADMIDISQSNTPSTCRAWNTARDAAQAVSFAKSTYLPHLTATVVGGYNHTRDGGRARVTLIKQALDNVRAVQAEGGTENTDLDLMTAIGISPNTRLQRQGISNSPLSRRHAYCAAPIAASSLAFATGALGNTPPAEAP